MPAGRGAPGSSSSAAIASTWGPESVPSSLRTVVRNDGRNRSSRTSPGFLNRARTVSIGTVGYLTYSMSRSVGSATPSTSSEWYEQFSLR